MRGRPVKEKADSDVKISGAFELTGEINETMYGKAISIARILGQEITVKINGFPVPVHPDSTITGLHILHMTLHELGVCYDKIASLEKEILTLKDGLQS